MERPHLSRLLGAATAMVVGVLLSGCGAVGVRLGPPATAAPDDATVQFCADFRAAGGDASTVGPLPLSAPKEELEAAVTLRLTTMGDLEPPDSIRDTWDTWRNYFDDVRAALRDQPAGSVLNDDDLIEAGIDLYPQSRLVRNFVLTNCG